MPEKDTKDKPNQGRRTVTVNVTLHGQSAGQALPSARAYLFDRAGRLVDSKPAGSDAVKFEVQTNQDYRVTVGPDALGQSKKPPANLAATLAKANAVSQDIRQQAPQKTIAIKVYPNIWICWFPTCINVHGTVTKAGAGNICVGTVQIFEVDLDCTLDKFTFSDLSALKVKLLEKLSVSSVSTQSLRSASAQKAVTSGRFNARAANSGTSLGEAATTIAALQGASLAQYIAANKAILSPFWCELIPDSAFCWQELGEAAIQSDGTFSAEICFWCPDDLPDLYFEVIQNLDGSEVEISDPQIACSTYYGYDGSQSVNIIVDDPRAVSCLPTGPVLGDLYVWPTAIGNVDLGGIDGLETLLGTGLLPGNTPWGGTLPLQMYFHPDLQANNVKYYRWSYKFDGDADFTPINLPVTHRYMTVVDLPGPIVVIHLNSVNLGPKTIGAVPNLFEIPDATLPWVDIDDPADRPFAYFDSTGGVTPHRSGMCTLLLEMFDGAGNLVPCNNALGASTLDDQAGDPAAPGNFTYLLPEIGGPPDTFTNAPTPNITDHGRLIFRILVDNNQTVAELPSVSTPLGTADTCGLLHYSSLSDNVELDYVAWHPNNFLDWDLTITRGLFGVVASIPPSPPATNTSSGSPGLPAAFNNPAGTLLGACVQAAFAVNLDCYARATDGYSRQSQYDSSATIAFALLHP
jgi:predicted HicB family RNase H-like nuclease